MPCEADAVVNVEAARRACDEVIAALSRADRARIDADREVHVRAGITALARLRALLISVVAVDRAERPDVVGVVLRAMLEVWYFGVIVLLGDEDDLARLDADNRYWKNEFAKYRAGVEAEAGDAKKFSVWQRARRAGELMAEVREDPASPVEWYREMYAGESLVNAHAGPSSLGSYLFIVDDVVGVNFDPDVDEGLRYGRLLLASGLAVMLGRWVYERAGIDTADLDRIEFPFTQDGPT